MTTFDHLPLEALCNAKVTLKFNMLKTGTWNWHCKHDFLRLQKLSHNSFFFLNAESDLTTSGQPANSLLGMAKWQRSWRKAFGSGLIHFRFSVIARWFLADFYGCK